MHNKGKFQFNPRTLQYEPIKRGAIDWIQRIGIFSVIIITLSSGLAYLFYQMIDSPKEASLKREIEVMEMEYKLLLKDFEQVETSNSEAKKHYVDLFTTVFGSEPVTDQVWEGGVGGSERYSELNKYSAGQLIKKLKTKAAKMKYQAKVLDDTYKKLEVLAVERTEKLNHIPAIQPIDNKDLTRIASGFGFRRHPILRYAKMHAGIDFTAPRGTPVYATGNGVVEAADRRASGYGNRVLIDHGYGMKSHYCHLNRYIVKPGQKVKRWQVIGYVGSTGLSTAPHLHYEIEKDGEKVDPIDYFYQDIPVEMYQKAKKIASQPYESLD